MLTKLDDQPNNFELQLLHLDHLFPALNFETSYINRNLIQKIH